MIGKRKVDATLFDVGNVFPFAPSPKSFHGQLALVSDKLFNDEDFEALYSQSRGRPSVPPSQLALVLLLQNYEGLSDDEAVIHTACDLRWAAVLRRHAGTQLCAKSTLQLFRAQLLLHEEYGLLLKRSLIEARKKGLLKGQHLAAAVDTKPIFGRGAVEDTYNLLATGMLQLARAVARSRKETLPVFLMRHGFERLDAPSFKGTVDIDWSDEQARAAVLTDQVADARRLMAMAAGSDPHIKKAADLLEQLLLQDIEEEPSDKGRPLARLKKGTARGRIPSATDPEQRHGRKSKSKRFVGSKASIAVDPDTGLILATDVLAGDEPDATGVLDLIEQAEANTGAPIGQILGDCAYGSGATREQFENAQRELIAKVPSASGPRDLFAKSAFRIELPVSGQSLELARVMCPGGAFADRVTPERDGGVTFYFDTFCGGCALRERCTHSKHGRSLHLHPQERLLQAAQALQASPEGRAKLRKRIIVENGLARLGNLGIGQARYIGQKKTKLQVAIAATVANLRRIWNRMAAPGRDLSPAPG